MYMYDEYARTPTRQCQYRWTKSKTFKCDGDGGGGGGGSSRLTRSPESDPHARGRVALHCVHMKDHHYLGGNFDFAEQNCYAILKK